MARIRQQLLISALVVVSIGCGRAPAQRPNVILFVIDTLRSDSVSANGHPIELTPNIDRLAAEGFNFTAAFAHSTWTKPSMATLFTGTFADRHRVRTPVENVEGRQVAARLAPQLHTLAERLHEAGYRTAAFVNQVHLQPKFGFDQGFDHYEWSTGKSAHDVNRALHDWVSSSTDRPLFLYLHYLDPHWPYRERQEDLREALGSLGVDPPPPHSGDKVEQWLAAGLAPGSIQGLRDRYDHGVAFADQAVGYALDILTEAGLTDSAIIVVTSDHGEGFMEHGRLLHGYAPFDEVSRVPLVIRVPEQFDLARSSISEPVGLVDLMPTLLELAGLQATEEGDRGRSLVPLMSGQGRSTGPIYIEASAIRAVRTAGHKLIRYPDGRVEFYDLASDASESRPLDCDETCLELSAELDLQIELAASWKDDPAALSVELDEADLERLRALGYMND